MKAKDKADLHQFLALAEGWTAGFRTTVSTPEFTDSPEPAPECVNLIEFTIALKNCSRCQGKRSVPDPGVGSMDPLDIRVIVVTITTLTSQTHATTDLLEKMLSSIFLDLSKNCRCTSIVKCSPEDKEYSVSNSEIAQCLPWLAREVELAKNAVILALGTDSTAILSGKNETDESLLGEFFTWRGIPVIGTHHPARLLENSSFKRPAWEHLKRLRAFLDSHILEES